MSLYVLVYDVPHQFTTLRAFEYIEAANDSAAATAANGILADHPAADNAALYGPLPEISLG